MFTSFFHATQFASKFLLDIKDFVIFAFEFLYPPDVHVGHYEGWKYEVDNCSCKGHVKTADGLFIERNAAPA